MKKDVLITIKGTRLMDGECDTVELMTSGTFSRRKGEYYISYEESEATGYEGSKTMLRVEGDRKVTMTRRGSTKSQLIIERDKRHLCHYDIGLGELLVGIHSQDIVSTLHDDGGELYFRYTLDINTSLASENEVSILVREKQQDA